MTVILQDEAEIAAFAEIVKAEGVLSFLEIGSKFGGSLERIAQAMPKGSRVVSVDLPNGTKAWRESKLSLERTISNLKRSGYDCHLIWGDSQDQSVVERVRKLGPFDAIFIDGDHRMPGVTSDWKNYSPMGRIVGFHDIAWERAADWVGTRIDVPQFWNEIKQDYRHEEFRHCKTGRNNGIGVLWRE